MSKYKINPKLPKPPVSAVIPGTGKVVVFSGAPGEGQEKATQADLKVLFESNTKTVKGLKVVVEDKTPTPHSK